MLTMNRPRPFQTLLFFFLYFSVNPYLYLSAACKYLSRGSSLSVERSDDLLVSQDHSFSAGFQRVGDNAYCFAIWYTKSANFTPVWMANRNVPVNGRRSALSLRRDGNLVLTDAGPSPVWATKTFSILSVQLRLSNTGNLILQTSTNITLWQSFDFPTDTLLPKQRLTRNTKLISSQSRSNHSSGFYSFYFDNDNVLRLLYDGPNISSVYWPDPGRVSWDNDRTTYNSSRVAMVNELGRFQSSDNLRFHASEYGRGTKRRLTMDYDGNLRLYSLDEENGSWGISWQAISSLCTMHGLCGPNSLCIYAPERRCICPPGFKHKDPTDWSQGCEPTFNLSCDPLDSKFIIIPNTDFYGYDYNFTENLTLQSCKNICLSLCDCKAFMYDMDGVGRCFPKTLFLNGYQSSNFGGIMHIRVPRNGTISDGSRLETTAMNCDPKSHEELARLYGRKQENNALKYLLWFVVAIGIVEVICIVTGWWYMLRLMQKWL